MRALIPHQTGAFSYQCTITTQDTTGSFSFGFGQSGIDEKKVSLSGISGELYDSNGYIVGSYRRRDSVNISGDVFLGHHNYHINENLVRTNVTGRVSDVNHVFFDKNASSEYSLSYSVNGVGQEFGDKSILYLTDNTSSDEEYIDIAESVLGKSVSTGSGYFTGALTDSQKTAINLYDIVIIGVGIEQVSLKSGSYSHPEVIQDWAELETSIISLNGRMATRTSGLGWSTTPSYYEQITHEDVITIIPHHRFFRQSSPDGFPFAGYKSFSFYKPSAVGDSICDIYSTSCDYILYDWPNLGIIPLLEGKKGVMVAGTGLVSGKRCLIQTPITGISDISNNYGKITDEAKKIYTTVIYDYLTGSQ